MYSEDSNHRFDFVNFGSDKSFWKSDQSFKILIIYLLIILFFSKLIVNFLKKKEVFWIFIAHAMKM